MKPIDEDVMVIDGEGEKFARAFFDLWWELVEEKEEKEFRRKPSQKEYALKVFGYERGFYAVKKGEMRLTLAHAFSMAKAIGWKFPRLIELTRIKMEEEGYGNK